MEIHIKLVPLSIVTEQIWKLQRYSDINEAIDRYLEADIDVPSSWIKELSKLETELKIR